MLEPSIFFSLYLCRESSPLSFPGNALITFTQLQIHTWKLPSTTTVWSARHWAAPVEQSGGGIGVLLKRRLSFPLAQIYPDGLQAPTGLYLSEIKYCWYSSDGSCSWGGWLAAGTAESIDMIGREGILHDEQMLGNGINVKVYSLKECVPMWPFCYLTHFDW